jgi:DNA-binding IclR family transcriptional regulator
MIRERGYATCRQELSLGVESIAAPIFNNQQVEAAISFNLPNMAPSKKHVMEKVLVSHLLKTAKDIST